MHTSSRFSAKRFFFLFLLTIAAGILDALCDKLFADILLLPLFMDTVFCMAVTFYGGLLCGIGAAAVLQLYYFITWIPGVNHIDQLYFICSVLAAVTAWAYKTNVIDRKANTPVILFAELLILSAIMCIVESVSGGLINCLTARIIGNNQEPTPQTDFMIIMFRAHISSPLAVAIISRIPVNLIDRLLSVFAAWGVYKGLQKIETQVTKKADK